jgi:flagella basal body P-ring formation protein FlgA
MRYFGRRFLRSFFMTFIITFITCFAAFTAPFLSHAAEINKTLKISIPAAVLVEGGSCSLAEIAEIEGPKDLADRVGGLLLSVEDGAITRVQVIEALKVSGLEGVRVELKMPEAVKAVPGTASEVTTPGAGTPAGQALEPLIKSLASWEWGVEVQHQGSVPEGRLVAPSSIVPGTPAVTLKFRDASGRERSLAARLIWTQPALVLKRSVKRDEILRAPDVEERIVRVNKPGVYASKISQVTGRSVKKNLSQGETLPLNLITDAPIIERGKSVAIIVRSGGLVVSAKGEALESGALGEAIKVRNTASKAILTAVVVAEDTVEVNIP